jgi:oligoendopeptidase F
MIFFKNNLIKIQSHQNPAEYEEKNCGPEWDLGSLYKDGIKDKKIIEDLKNLKNLTDDFKKKYEKQINDIFINEIEKFTSSIIEYEQISELIAKIGTFGALNKAKYSSNKEIAIFYQNLSDEILKIETNLIFFVLEIKSLNKNELFLKVESKEDLKKYLPWFKKIFLFEKYYLNDKEEKIFHLKETTSSGLLIRLFDEFFADLRFEFRSEKLSDNQIFNYLMSVDEQKRKEAGISIGKTLKENGKFLSIILNMVAKDKAIEDEIRGFRKPISSRNLSNNIDDDIVENLIQSVKEKYKQIPNRYYKLKAKLLKKDKLNFWDRNAPISKDAKRKFSWNESKEIVLSAFNKFSGKLADEARKFFDNQWIDAKIIDGKTSGAFCHPSIPSSNPYMLMNFHGDVYDIMTLAHELGHCVHYVFSKKNGYLNFDIPLTLAETASVFAEQLVFRYLLEVDTEVELKRTLIAKKIEDMINTVFRQISFVDFEIQIHQKRLSSELSEEEICQIWMNIQKDVLGDAFSLSEEYKYYWSYISHFIHAPFYVYSYAFGDCLVNSLYKFYLNNEHNFCEKYIDMLSKGGTEDIRQILKPFNLDVSDKNFWNSGLGMIEELIDILERMC